MKEALVAFVPSRALAKARAFYVEVLGLTFSSEDAFAVVVSSNGVTVRITKVDQFEPQPFTVLGWTVEDVSARVRELTTKGVVFLRYDGMKQDARGVWAAPGGARVAWFSDPDGNVLSLTQLP